MQEKTMVADTLAGINGELTRYAGMIAQSENKELKQTLKQFLSLIHISLCCHSYLSDFVPVSIKMAKEQNLSLNPTKISGVCGRLMCCLKNEEDTYEELNRKLPGVGDYVQTADGLHGEVQSVNVLRQLVKVLVEAGDEKELKEYEADTLQFKRRRGKKGGQELSKEEQKELEKLEEIEEKEEAEERAEKRAEQRQDRREQRTDGENRGDNRGENRRRDGRRDDNRRNNNRGENNRNGEHQNRNDNRGGDNGSRNENRRDNNRGDRRRENRPDQVRENGNEQSRSGSQIQQEGGNSQDVYKRQLYIYERFPIDSGISRRYN